MLLAIDVGNTEITVGLFQGDRLAVVWRLTTVASRTPDEWAATLTAHLVNAGHSTHEVRAAVQASVAPAVTEALASGIQQATGARPVVVDAASPLSIELDVDEPMTVGADRVVNTLAACELYRRDTIVVDYGTATTFDCVTQDRRFIGGVIAPGVLTAAENLTRRAAKLPGTELLPPQRVIGRRTEDCIRSGVLFGAADSTDGMVRRIKAEWPGGGTPLVVGTGGLVALVAPLSTEIEQVEPHLTLLGLRIAAKHLGVAW
ncbi:MAG TPA: type III pantothenate kinase [Gemmatimonadales bacterium]|nr:type III pantothenate kinase [Gemmatimonadales bacterium]